MQALLAQVAVSSAKWGEFLDRYGMGAAFMLLVFSAYFMWFRWVHIPDRNHKRKLEAERELRESHIAERAVKSWEGVAEATLTLVPVVKEIREEQRAHVAVCRDGLHPRGA